MRSKVSLLIQKNLFYKIIVVVLQFNFIIMESAIIGFWRMGATTLEIEAITGLFCEVIEMIIANYKDKINY
jgi:hypothetical protein